MSDEVKNVLKVKKTKVMILAGEASGDLQGAMLVKELRKKYSDLEFCGTGGVRMREEGVEILIDSTTLGVIGPFEGIKLLPKLLKIYLWFKKVFVKIKPDLVIFIDTPSFNMRIAKIAKKEGIKSVYYFPPSAWSKSIKRAKEVSDTVDMVINVFSETANIYDKAGVEHFFTGHPLVDFLSPCKKKSKQELLKSLNLEEGPRYVALLPGSRTQEVNRILPLLVEVGEELIKKVPDIHFLVPIAYPLIKEKVNKGFFKASFPYTTFDRRSPEVIAVSDLVILASGSAALEAAIMEKPMIITYKVNWLDSALIKKFVKLNWVGLPNLIIQREIIPEYLQENATIENIVPKALSLLEYGKERKKMLEDLRELNVLLGEPGVVQRIAKHIGEKFL